MPTQGILPKDRNWQTAIGGTSSATDTSASIRPFQYNPDTRGITVHIVGDSVGIGGGTQYTEDAAAAANPVGNALNLIRADTLAGVTSADGDNVAARGTDKGELYVKHVDSIPVTGTFWQATQPVSLASVPSHAVTNAGTFATQIDGAALTALQLIDNMISGNEAQVDIVAALPAGTNALGKLLPPDVDIATHTNYAKKYYTNAGAVTDGIIWSPAAGKRWHVVSLFIQVSAAATITLEDDLAAGDSVILKMELAANSGITIPFPEKYPLASGEDASDLIVTSSAGNIYITCVGYEI